jgi:hypothetical protein
MTLKPLPGTLLETAMTSLHLCGRIADARAAFHVLEQGYSIGGNSSRAGNSPVLEEGGSKPPLHARNSSPGIIVQYTA